MDRRNFLTLLGLGAVAIATPEPVRSYFFGPWAPRDSGLVTLTEEWAPGYVRYAAELVENRILPASYFRIDRTLRDGVLYVDVWPEEGLDRIPGTNLYDPTRRDLALLEGAGYSIATMTGPGIDRP